MQPPKLNKWIAMMVVVYLVIIGLQASIAPERRYFSPQGKPEQIGEVGKESKELAGGVLLGFREVAAGLLWVRSEDYFHSGKYEQLVPLFYIVTWLDPHQIDVYSTGAWHLAYNLGDERLIPEATKFLNQGIENNKEIYDLYFQQAWLQSQKVKDYGLAVKYARLATQHPQDDKSPAPHYVFSQLAHDLESDGQIPEMLKQWDINVNTSWQLLFDKMMESSKGSIRQKLEAFKTQANGLPSVDLVFHDPEINAWVNGDADLNVLKQGLSGQIHNRDTNNLRRNFFRKGVGQPGYAFDWNADPPHWVNVGDGKLHLQNTHFNYQVKRIAPRVLQVTGHIEGADFFGKKKKNNRTYTRLAVLFRDKNYEARYNTHPDDFNWQKKNLTWYKNDQISFPTADIRDSELNKDSTEFSFKVDFSKDPWDNGHNPKDLFPFKADEYELTVYLDPTAQSPFHQDYYGWKGEGLTDDHYLKVDKRGVRIITKTVTLKRSDVL